MTRTQSCWPQACPAAWARKTNCFCRSTGSPWFGIWRRHICRQLGGPVTVVTGHDTGAVMAALDGLPVHITFNPDFADQGQSSSVLAGLSATSDAEVTIIALADQPLLNACDITEFLQAHHAGDSSRISIPVSGDMRGNPVLVPQALKRRLIDDPRNPGCRRFIQANPDLVQKITVTSAGFFTDMDTPDAYDAILSHLKEPAL